MRHLTTYLMLAAVAGMVAPSGIELSQVVAQPSDGQAGPPGNDELDGPPGPGQGRRPEGRRGERRRGPGGPGEFGPGGFGRPPGGHPIIEALDVDGNHEISATEIEGAIIALKKLDRNGDGKLTQDELRPPRPRRGGSLSGDRPERGRRGAGFGPPRGNRERGGDELPEEIIARVTQRFMQADKDGDSKISKEEAPGPMAEIFDRVDADGSGFVDENEIREMIKHSRRRGGHGPAGRGGDRERNDRPNKRPPLEE